uniref:Uncharacterized protein n=1 Tax=Micrurus paraensis TaxID=1970185 RepID=A0A2D4KHH0_9SAUR
MLFFPELVHSFQISSSYWILFVINRSVFQSLYTGEGYIIIFPVILQLLALVAQPTVVIPLVHELQDLAQSLLTQVTTQSIMGSYKLHLTILLMGEALLIIMRFFKIPL